MKTTLKELLDCAGSQGYNNLGPFTKLVRDASLGVRVRFRIAQIWKQIQAHLEDLNEQRLALCQEYGVLNEETQNWDIPDEKMPLFNKEAQLLLETDVELVGEQLSINDLELKYVGARQDDDLSLSSEDILKLEWLFSDFNEAAVEEEEEPVYRKKRGLKAV